RVVAEMPPGIIAELLRSAVDLPAAERLETLLIHDADAAGRLAIFVAQRSDIDPTRPAVDRVRAGIAGLVGKLCRLDHLDDLGRARIWFGIENVDARGAQAWHDEIAALHMRMRRGRTQARPASVPGHSAGFA